MQTNHLLHEHIYVLEGGFCSVEFCGESFF